MSDLRAGSGLSGVMVGAADAYANGVLKNQALANSLFDRFANFTKEQRDEKRRLKLEKQADENHDLNKANAVLQKELLEKQKNYFEKDRDLKEKQINANISQIYTQNALNNENLKAIKREQKEKEDYLNLLKNNPSLAYGNSTNEINEEDLEKILNEEEYLNTNRF